MIHSVITAALAAIFVLAGCATPTSRMNAASLTFPQVATLAGDGSAGAVDGQAGRVNRPHGLALAADGALYFADRGNHQIRAVKRDAGVITVAGAGKPGFADGPVDQAQFNEPIAVAVERTGAIYVADRNNHRIRKIRTDGSVATLAGNGEPGFADGSGGAARFNQPYGVALNQAETALYVADYLNHAIRRIDLLTGQVSTLAGNGVAGNVDGEGRAARFNQPYNVRVDAKGMLWIPDQLNHSIRTVTPTGRVLTVAGAGKPGAADGRGAAAQFNNPTGVVALPDGSAIVADRNNEKLRRVSADGSVTALAGTGEAGFADGPVVSARFKQPLDVAFDAKTGRLFVSEDKGHRIRVLDKDAR